MRSTVPKKRKRCLSASTLAVVLALRSPYLEYVIESVTVSPVLMSGAVTGIPITTGTSVTKVVGSYLLITFVITIQTVTRVMMRVTVVIYQDVP